LAFLHSGAPFDAVKQLDIKNSQMGNPKPTTNFEFQKFIYFIHPIPDVGWEFAVFSGTNSFFSNPSKSGGAVARKLAEA